MLSSHNHDIFVHCIYTHYIRKYALSLQSIGFADTQHKTLHSGNLKRVPSYITEVLYFLQITCMRNKSYAQFPILQCNHTFNVAFSIHKVPNIRPDIDYSHNVILRFSRIKSPFYHLNLSNSEKRWRYCCNRESTIVDKHLQYYNMDEVVM